MGISEGESASGPVAATYPQVPGVGPLSAALCDARQEVITFSAMSIGPGVPQFVVSVCAFARERSGVTTLVEPVRAPWSEPCCGFSSVSHERTDQYWRYPADNPSADPCRPPDRRSGLLGEGRTCPGQKHSRRALDRASGRGPPAFRGRQRRRDRRRYRGFLTGSRASVSLDRVLAIVLFTDIVGSTEKVAALATTAGAICSTIITPRSGAT